jgi:type IV secretory pathway TraG/TraD family ATPase VirD4
MRSAVKDRIYLGLMWDPVTGRTGDAVYFDLDDIAHMTLCGPTGCGKGQIEIPNRLWNGLRDVNIIGVDPTGQNRAVTNRWRGTFSDSFDLNPFELHGRKGVGCNPCLSVKMADDAMRLAEAVEEVQPGAAHDPFWAGSSQGLIAGGIWGIVQTANARNETPTLPKVHEVLTTGLEQFAAFMAQNGDYALRVLLTRYQESNRTIDGIKMHSHNAMKWLLSDPIRKFLSVKKGEGIDWTQLKNGPRPVTVDVTLPIDKIVTHAPVLKVVVVDALNTLYRIGDVKGRKTVFMLSEFASYGRVGPILTALGAGRKFGIRLCPMVVQDSGQLETIYGRSAMTTILGNSGCLLAFAPSPVDTETADWLSKAGGTHWVPTLSASDDPHDGRARLTVNEREERVWPPDKIRRLPPFHALVFRHGMEPQPVYCAPYFKGELDFLIGGRYDSDPYHPASAAPEKRPTGKAARIAAMSAAAIAGGVWLSHGLGHGGVSHPPAPVVQVGDPAPVKANPPAHASPSPILRRHPPRRHGGARD